MNKPKNLSWIFFFFLLVVKGTQQSELLLVTYYCECSSRFVHLYKAYTVAGPSFQKDQFLLSKIQS